MAEIEEKYLELCLKAKMKGRFCEEFIDCMDTKILYWTSAGFLQKF